MKTQSSELQRIAEEAVNNEKRLAAYRMKTTINAYKDKKVCKEYEQFLDKIGHP